MNDSYSYLLEFGLQSMIHYMKYSTSWFEVSQFHGSVSNLCQDKGSFAIYKAIIRESAAVTTVSTVDDIFFIEIVYM